MIEATVLGAQSSGDSVQIQLLIPIDSSILAFGNEGRYRSEPWTTSRKISCLHCGRNFDIALKINRLCRTMKWQIELTGMPLSSLMAWRHIIPDFWGHPDGQNCRQGLLWRVRTDQAVDCPLLYETYQRTLHRMSLIN